VVEANYARVPLIVLSANRPYELLGTGANQTMEQLGYFGTQVRATISLGLAEDAPDRMPEFNATWRSATCRVLAAATGSRTANAGPVQFDIPLREPLVPGPEPHGVAIPPGRPGGQSWTYTPPVTFDQPLDIDLTPDTVVIAGHGAGAHPNLELLPTVAEPTSFSGRPPPNPLHPLTLRLLRPKQVIMLGRPTLHRPVSALLADPQVPVYALTTGPRWPDVSGNSQATGTRAVISGAPHPAWLQRCAEMNRHANQAVRAQLAAHPLTTGLHVAAAVADALRAGDQLVLGASNPVRDAALVGLGSARHRGQITVRSNRGVAGIDGTVSTAIGAALAFEGRTVALIGDLTFVHDSSGLLIGPTEPTPQRLTIVVSNDNGGGIFELLEQGDPRFSDVSSRIFGTPHDVDVGALCRAYHVESRQIEVDELNAALGEPAPGMRVLEVKADRSSLRQLHAAIKAAL
jgi:2-succinyl-5-enolpyruvyl-6-hydroxy-3-cyclohexene-1-carboxylate synthase